MIYISKVRDDEVGDFITNLQNEYKDGDIKSELKNLSVHIKLSPTWYKTDMRISKVGG